jgi:hypothetical protein
MSTNKYLEKAAALFPSIGYHKSLSKEEKHTYTQEYRDAGISSFKNAAKVAGGNVVSTIGAAVGVVGGMAGGKKLAQVLSRRALNKNVIKGVGKIGEGSYDVTDSLKKGLKTHAILRPAGTLAGGVIGATPGASILDHVRHNHAKGVMEKKRKDNE